MISGAKIAFCHLYAPVQHKKRENFYSFHQNGAKIENLQIYAPQEQRSKPEARSQRSKKGEKQEGEVSQKSEKQEGEVSQKQEGREAREARTIELKVVRKINKN